MGATLSNFKDRKREDNSYVQLLKTYTAGYHTQEGKCEDIGMRYCEKIDRGEMTISQVVEDIVEYTRWYNMKPQDVQFCRLSIHLALGLCFHYDVRHKPTVRVLLLELLPYSRGIDKGLFMRDLLQYWDLSPTNPLVKKSYYYLHFAAGFKIDHDEAAIGSTFKGQSRIVYKDLANADHCYYLDIPIGHPSLLLTQSSVTDTFIGQQSIALACASLKPRVVLILLRHGVSPLGRTLEQLLTTLGAVETVKGAGIRVMNAPKEIVLECLMYCLRVVKTIRLRITGQTFADIEKEDPDYVYFVKPEAQHLVPAHHWMSPCPLKHLCRCRIREALLESDNIPEGIHELPGLSQDLVEYLDLQFD